MSELKPCPFCGGEAKVNSPTRIAHNWWAVGVMCTTCGAQKISDSDNEDEARERVIEAWNTRYERTCHDVGKFQDFLCSECGGVFDAYDDSEYQMCPEYCPNCGAKVVEESHGN